MTHSAQRVFESLRDSILEILPELPADQIQPGGRLRDLGANSVDRAEILSATMRRLRIRMPLVDLAQAENIQALIAIFQEKVLS